MTPPSGDTTWGNEKEKDLPRSKVYIGLPCYNLERGCVGSKYTRFHITFMHRHDIKQQVSCVVLLCVFRRYHKNTHIHVPIRYAAKELRVILFEVAVQ